MNKQRDRSLVPMLRAAVLAGSAGFALSAGADTGVLSVEWSV